MILRVAADAAIRWVETLQCREEDEESGREDGPPRNRVIAGMSRSTGIEAVISRSHDPSSCIGARVR